MEHVSYLSDIDAEPLHRYQRGGYHPIKLGDTLKNGRYKVLHKLGWGGYSTVWAARDQRKETYAAIKITTSEIRDDKMNREIRVLKTLAAYPTPQHVISMLDAFDLTGPNDGRLPGDLAKRIIKQTLIGLDTLHQHEICHGDLHTRNLVFTMPCMDGWVESEFMKILGKPEIGYVRRKDGKALEPGMPEYIVRPALYRSRSLLSREIKIIDFGESFLQSSVPETLHTPLPVRAPEVIFKDPLDYRVDLWSMGCLLFELVVGQPPFDSILTTPPILVSQMRQMTNDTLPARWKASFEAMTRGSTADISGPTLQEWLEEMYFDGERKEILTQEDIAKLGKIIGRLLRFEPSTRASAREILNDPWLSDL